MNSNIFKAGGALTDLQTKIYVERESDREVFRHCSAMDYILLVEPRQQGKTSLINRLMYHPMLNPAVFAYIDVTTLDRSSEKVWYHSLRSRILRQWRKFMAHDTTLPIMNSVDWRDFLFDASAFASDSQRNIVIVLDEIGAVTFPWATEFFSVLRDVFNSRQAETEFRHLTFVLAGAFHPRDLIKDENISPFNIACRVRLPDFTVTQVRELVSQGGWPQEVVSVLAERIFYWTGGQPYLTQKLCSALGPNPSLASIDHCVDRLRREDENHLSLIIEKVNDDIKLKNYVVRIKTGEHIKFYPQENRRQAQPEMLGVLRANENGYCEIRNRICDQILETEHTNLVATANSFVKQQINNHEIAIPKPRYGIGNKWAVLIGVNNYDDRSNYRQLNVCVNDAEALSKQLINGSYDPVRIRLLTDDSPEIPTRTNILTTVKAIADATEPNDLLLFYYSGHGDEVAGESYLVACDGRHLTLSDTGVPISRIKQILDDAPARAKVIILDACHSGAQIGKAGPKPMSSEFVNRVFEQAEGIAILASCKHAQQSYEWPLHKCSVFTHFLLEALAGNADYDQKGFITVQDTSRHVVNGVKLWASQHNLSQTPTLQYLVAGDIILAGYNLD